MSDNTFSLRWRVVGGRIPLMGRHLRSLGPLGLSQPLAAWIRTRLEWALANLVSARDDAVLCLAIDPAHDVSVTLEPLRARPELSLECLVEAGEKVTGAVWEGESLEGVLFFEREGCLYASAPRLDSAVSTLTADLARTLGIGVEVGCLSRAALAGAEAAFLASNEFGCVPVRLGGQEEWLGGRTSAKSACARLKACLEQVIPPVA
ncbi:MAG: hypothetical protein LBD25_03740 [Coriobacteriales bacterium]|jgi:hypothetical protein|nr:hypothetical protein [Coriobacteriales bacterium]